MENTKIIHPLYVHEDGTSTDKEMQEASCTLIGMPGKKNITKRTATEEELQREYDYYIAEKLAEKMLAIGLISADECNRLSAENRRFFSPYLAKLAC